MTKASPLQKPYFPQILEPMGDEQELKKIKIKSELKKKAHRHTHTGEKL